MLLLTKRIKIVQRKKVLEIKTCYEKKKFKSPAKKFGYNVRICGGSPTPFNNDFCSDSVRKKSAQ